MTDNTIRRISGGVSKVLIKDQTVIKTYEFPEDSLVETTEYAYLTTELCILNLLDGTDGFPHIIEIIRDPPKYGIVMPYLGEPVGQCDHPLRVFTKIVKLVAILHQHNIVHCDLKPKNVLIDQHHHVSVIDFSHSYIMGNFHSLIKDNRKYPHMDAKAPMTLNDRETISTYAYTAPETYDRQVIKDTSMDIWGLGCILYELVTGECLFDDLPREDKPCNECVGYLDYIKDQHQHMDLILSKIEQIKGHSIEKQLMNKMFAIKPRERPTAIDLLHYLGVDYTPPQKYEVDMNLTSYHPSKLRLRCFNFPHYVCMLVDNLIDYLSDKIKDKDRYEACYLVHMIIGVVFMDKCGYEPFDVLYHGADYMRCLSHIITKFKLSKMYSG